MAYVNLRLGTHATLSEVYLYDSVETLQALSCVHTSATAFYDGAIHVSSPSKGSDLVDIKFGLIHEGVHHALASAGINEPMWLHEGAAVDIAKDTTNAWWTWRPTHRPLPMERMVRGAVHGANAQTTDDFYGQAYAMVRFLQGLCAGRRNCSIHQVMERLRSGAATPDSLFDLMTEERIVGLDLEPDALWQDYWSNGLRHSDETMATLRAHPTVGQR